MTRELIIGNRRIADDAPAFVVAEVGHNHQGNVDTCKAIFRAAAECGADAVKLQKRDNRTLYTRAFYEQPYNSEHAFGATYGEHREALEFGWDQYAELKDYAESLGLIFFATAFDEPSADFLAELGVPAFKIASGDLQSIPLLQHVAALGKPVILSTGGGTIIDVDRAYRAIQRLNPQLAILQCTASYPVMADEMNLRVIESYRSRYHETVIGLSDHQDGIAMAPVAFALGARIFEKHFTLHRSWKGSDQAFSLEPGGLRRLVRDLGRVPLALGDGWKRPYPSEVAALAKMQKCLVAAGDLPVGHALAAGDMRAKSPWVPGGLPPYMLEQIKGFRLARSVIADEPLGMDHLAASSTVTEPNKWPEVGTNALAL